MKVIKFKVNSDYFELFKAECLKEEIVIKKKLYNLHMQDFDTDYMEDYFPEDHEKNQRNLTLKVNVDFFKSVTGKCYEYDIRLREYMPYLIYKYLLDNQLILKS